ncbi:MAG: aminoacyl-tRNA hydrolase [Nitrosomonadales bacterium]|jgi:PTH1 family peptidyl-tRNA hydrolase|nr:aminoacyl-tRNA hydrolase [Nitrosomonadales bacterium]MBT3918467.1 aminoacyl-tRNA hydrolase [Nitrosomonadales bacterium]MBT4182445.1 aminoacyl-tRNA hydrolase [Nitrosomonadales bacterium]MBT4570580.1 aminoacyl-tRNA hydrolase [Nitrosomonadales bacterium]MBT4758938.1 aminoacyl-tRNA hydrolase [Nitrosomonadales bacterium]
MNKIKLFAGLGNPGDKYQNTRHNCGFWWIDFVVKNHRLNLKHDAKFSGEIAKYTDDGNCFFLKPTTFMNESGKSLAAVANFYKIRPEEILVIHDELDIEPGKIKLKLGGGDGGHNGLKSIAESIKSKNFWRIRVGIGHPGNKSLVSNFVLKPPLKKESELIEDSILNSYKIFSLLKNGQFEKAMLNLHSA